MGRGGPGLQIVEVLSDQGEHLMISSRKAGDPEVAARHLRERGIKADWIATDNSKDDDIVRWRIRLSTNSGELTSLTTTPAQPWGAPAEDHPIDAWDKVMNLNIRSIFILSQQAGRKSMYPEQPQ